MGNQVNFFSAHDDTGLGACDGSHGRLRSWSREEAAYTWEVRSMRNDVLELRNRRVAISSGKGWSWRRLAHACVGAFLIGWACPARAADDNANSTPTAWWIYTGQSFDDIANTIKAKNARIVDITKDPGSGDSFTVSYVENTGAYAKKWWWYVGVDGDAMTASLNKNNARLISMSAYDVGGGDIRFAVAMVANTGDDAKGWYYYYGQSFEDIQRITGNADVRLTRLQSYFSNGQTFYTAILTPNKGGDQKQGWWYANVSPQLIANAVHANHARVLSYTWAGHGNFNAVLESCSDGCPAWWWYYGQDAQTVLSIADRNHARVMAAQSYGHCGSSACFATVMIGN
jgi:hypothetical protein